MHTTTWPRVLLLFVVLLAFVGSLGLLRTRLLHPRAIPTATPIAYCPVAPASPTNLIVIFPTPNPSNNTTLSIDLPGPILIDPTPCPAR